MHCDEVRRLGYARVAIFRNAWRHTRLQSVKKVSGGYLGLWYAAKHGICRNPLRYLDCVLRVNFTSAHGLLLCIDRRTRRKGIP